MGFNISGLVLNKNYENNFDELQEILGRNLNKVEEITFEEASSNWKEDDIYDIYFSEKGTLIFMSIDMCTEPYEVENTDTLTFVLSETSMSFSLNYCKDGKLERTIMETDGQILTDEGKALDIEKVSEDTSEVIWNQMEVVLGRRFWDIDFGEKAIRYDLIKQNNIPKQAEIPEQRFNQNVKSKKWWEFWK